MLSILKYFFSSYQDDQIVFLLDLLKKIVDVLMSDHTLSCRVETREAPEDRGRGRAQGPSESHGLYYSGQVSLRKTA